METLEKKGGASTRMRGNHRILFRLGEKREVNDPEEVVLGVIILREEPFGCHHWGNRVPHPTLHDQRLSFEEIKRNIITGQE